MDKNSKIDWWKDDFFQEFRPFFDTISSKVTNAQVRFYWEKLKLKKGMSFLDCPIGIGRIAIPLAKKGIKVTGIDTTSSYISEIESKAKKNNLPIKLFHLDMRRIRFENKFDATGNLGTSFGYFEKESDDVKVLKKLYKATKPGGKLVLHLINRDWIMKNYLSQDWQKVKNIKVLEERKFDYSKSVILSTWTFIKNGEQRFFDISIRLYSYHELRQMLEKVGFSNVTGYGNVKGDPIDRNTRDMFIFAQK